MSITPVELTKDDTMYTDVIPSNIELKFHQLVSLFRCTELENGTLDMCDDLRYKNIKTNFGILADKVGSGKSYIILALITVNPKPLCTFNKQNVYGQYNSLYVEYQENPLNYQNTNIIVCSFGLIDQWREYITTFNKDFRFKIVNSKKTVVEYLKDANTTVDILLLSSSFYKNIQTHFITNNICVNRLIFDEADTAITTNAKQIPAHFYWFVSASYKNLINPFPKYKHGWYSTSAYLNHNLFSHGIVKNMFIKTFFNSLFRQLPINDYSLFHKVIVKNTNTFVDESFALPAIRSAFIQCKDTISDLVNSMTTNTNIINSVNAGDLETAISYIKQNNKCDESHIINILKQDIDNSIINIQAKIDCYKSMVVYDEEQHMKKIAQMETQKNELMKRTVCLSERIKNDNLCIICYNTFANRTVTKCCGNSFCFECICTWFKFNNNCPLCKKVIHEFSDELIIVKNDNEFKTSVILDKISSLVSLLTQIKRSNPSSKILIFSEYEKPFERICKELQKLNIKYGYLKGTSLKHTLNLYKYEDIDVLLINSRAFGSGINLENTTDVIIYHFFNIEMEKQVIGRAQRPGRTKSLNTWYLFNNDEIKKNHFRNIPKYTLPNI